MVDSIHIPLVGFDDETNHTQTIGKGFQEGIGAIYDPMSKKYLPKNHAASSKLEAP